MSETRFTERAQAALRLAQECSAELGHGYVAASTCCWAWPVRAKGWPPRCSSPPGWSQRA